MDKHHFRASLAELYRRWTGTGCNSVENTYLYVVLDLYWYCLQDAILNILWPQLQEILSQLPIILDIDLTTLDLGTATGAAYRK